MPFLAERIINQITNILRSQYISLDFYVLRKSQKAKCGSYHRAAPKCAATVYGVLKSDPVEMPQCLMFLNIS